MEGGGGHTYGKYQPGLTASWDSICQLLYILHLAIFCSPWSHSRKGEGLHLPNASHLVVLGALVVLTRTGSGSARMWRVTEARLV